MIVDMCGIRSLVNLLLTINHRIALFCDILRLTLVEPEPGFSPMFAPLKTDSEQNDAMSSTESKYVGFSDPRQRRERRRAVALTQLIATITLVLSIAVSAAVVGIARACAPIVPSASASYFH